MAKAAKKPSKKAASTGKKKSAPAKTKKGGIVLRPMALVYDPLAQKLNGLFNKNRGEYFAKFKAAVGNDPANYVFGSVVRRLPDAPGSAIGMEPDPNNANNPNKWSDDIWGINESDRKLLQMVIAGNIFSKEAMLFDFSVHDGKSKPRVEIRTRVDSGAHVLEIAIYCAAPKKNTK